MALAFKFVNFYFYFSVGMSREGISRGPYSGESRTTKWRKAKQTCSEDAEKCDCGFHTFSDSDSSCSCEFHKYAETNRSPSSSCSCEYHKNISGTSSSCSQVDGSSDDESSTVTSADLSDVR